MRARAVEAAKINLSRAFARGWVCGRTRARRPARHVKTRRSAAVFRVFLNYANRHDGVVNGRFEPRGGGGGGGGGGAGRGGGGGGG